MYVPSNSRSQQDLMQGRTLTTNMNFVPSPTYTRVKFTGGGAPRLGPGPAIYDGFSSFGRQQTAEFNSSPSWGFGTSSNRPRSSKTASAPGPGAYKTISTIGSVPMSKFISAPACSLRGREKFGSMIDTNEAASSPGPGQYVVPRMDKNLKYSFGSRIRNSSKQRSPGPARYPGASSLGKQVNSTQQSLLGTSFGKAERPGMVNMNAPKVGPGQYVVPTALDRRGTRFSKSKQRPLNKSASAPGPADYRMASSMGRQMLSHQTSSPTARMSGRTKFGSCF